MAEDRDVQVPGGGNKKADPTSLSALPPYLRPNKLSESGQLGVSRTLGTQAAKEMGKGQMPSLGSQAASSAKATLDVAKTERLADLHGGGAKSKLRPRQKKFSASGRVPYSDYEYDALNGHNAGIYIGEVTPAVPTMGIDATGMKLGPFKFLPLEWKGAFPVLKLRQWHSPLPSATFLNSEEGDC